MRFGSVQRLPGPSDCWLYISAHWQGGCSSTISTALDWRRASLSLWVHSCEPQPSERPFIWWLILATVTGSTLEASLPVLLHQCRVLKQEFHTVIFVPKDIIPHQLGGYRGARFHQRPSDNGRGLPSWPYAAVFYCVSPSLPPGESQARRLWPISSPWLMLVVASVLFLDVCLCCCSVHSMTTEHNMLPKPPVNPSG